MCLERIDEPAPCNFGQQRVGGQGGVDIGLDVRDEAGGPVPGFVTVGVVQQNQPPERVALRLFRNFGLVGVEHFGTERVAERSEALRWPDRLDLDLRAHCGRIHRIDSSAKAGRLGRRGGHASGR